MVSLELNLTNGNRVGCIYSGSDSVIGVANVVLLMVKISYTTFFMRYLALDYGRRRTGVALSDEEGKWAFPQAVWEGWSRQRIIDEVLQLVRLHCVQCVVLGIPLATEGVAPEMQKPVLQLKELLQTTFREVRLNVTVELQDERFSTAVVLGQLREAGISQRAAREDNGAGSTDARAAAVILQNFLDRNSPFTMGNTS
ncbi:MAG: Holliday junction resolvase RuvX [Abditibacteriaceae bacterium]